MDVLAIIALVIALLLIAFVVVWLVGKWRSDSASAYQKRMTIERDYDVAILTAAKVLVVGDMAFVTKGVDIHNQIIYEKMPVNSSGTPIVADVIDGHAITLHQIASKLVDESIIANGADGVKLLTADQWKALGHDHESHKDALAYLMQLGVTKVQGGPAASQGTYVKKGETLHSLLRDLAVFALPLATGQRIDKA